MTKLSNLLIEKITKNLPEVIRNGDATHTYPGCLNLSFAFVEGESLLMALKDIALSSGSACTSASLEPSYVLRAIGADEDLAHSSIRYLVKFFSFCLMLIILFIHSMSIYSCVPVDLVLGVLQLKMKLNTQLKNV